MFIWVQIWWRTGTIFYGSTSAVNFVSVLENEVKLVDELYDVWSNYLVAVKYGFQVAWGEHFGFSLSVGDVHLHHNTANTKTVHP